jgi:hypothetical protein
MTYGAKESNTTEAIGLVLMILGLTIFTAAWAYGVGAIQLIGDVIGLVGFFGGFAVLWMARTGKQLMGKS